MKKILLTIVFLFVTFVLSGCAVDGSFKADSNTKTYNYALIEIGNTVEKVMIKDWRVRDYNGMIIITTEDNKKYYTHSSNIILLNE